MLHVAKIGDTSFLFYQSITQIISFSYFQLVQPTQRYRENGWLVGFLGTKLSNSQPNSQPVFDNLGTISNPVVTQKIIFFFDVYIYRRKLVIPVSCFLKSTTQNVLFSKF